MEFYEGAENLKIVHSGDEIELKLTGIYSIYYLYHLHCIKIHLMQ